jgi:hypothetical protein
VGGEPAINLIKSLDFWFRGSCSLFRGSVCGLECGGGAENVGRAEPQFERLDMPMDWLEKKYIVVRLSPSLLRWIYSIVNPEKDPKFYACFNKKPNHDLSNTDPTVASGPSHSRGLVHKCNISGYASVSSY